MRYIEPIHIDELRKKYKYIFGWSPGIEYHKRYSVNKYELDGMIDGKSANLGDIICGNKVSSPDVLAEFKNEKVCIIIYNNIEEEIIKQIYGLNLEADTIISRLVRYNGCDITYSSDREDLTMLDACNYLKIEECSYIDIGVCHPVVRNNTYLFYERGNYHGVLVEPNLQMCNLARLYRPENRIVQCGAGFGEDKYMDYYKRDDMPGHNTFVETIAFKKEMGISDQKIIVRNINRIIDENFERYPNILDIDTEGLDYDILQALNTDLYPIKIICVEACKSRKKFRDLLSGKGYLHFKSTIENDIFIRVKS
ncbi:FkbM family methyltransferase [Desulfitobacterium hafniense]|uniref:FkbM family methyltransferase n=1 Tax=Desulfitobacterium hafniense TaxID=49338 RepID=UPI00037A4CF2|nr:FkbM family methyltransferase [Desulfitobacterium hafniense]